MSTLRRQVRAMASAVERLAEHRFGRAFAGIGLSLAKSIATGHWHWFTYDKRGWWINRQGGGTLFGPTICTSTLEGLKRDVDHLWCYQTQLKPGDVVVDIGAGTGDHAFVFAGRVGSEGRVVAIEAHPLTAHCLRMTVERNHLDNTLVIEEAAWDSETTLLISNSTKHEGNAVAHELGECRVRARPVDDMLEPLQLRSIDLLKMNIEGAEINALRGMQWTLAHCKAIVISCHDFLAKTPDDPRRTRVAVIEFLRAAGFGVSTRTDDPAIWVRDYVYGRRTT